jgi:CheY-like chemotaxis protein
MHNHRVKRLPVSPLIERALGVAQRHLGAEELARRLQAPAEVIRDWTLGTVDIPEADFFRLVDILAELDPRLGREVRDSAAAGTAQKAKRCLVVDDNADAALTLVDLLRVLGHSGAPVIDSREAFAVAKRFKPDIAIIDLTMPHVDGFQLARAFRADEQLSTVCLVALTAMDSDGYREKTRRAGFDAHLRKPADIALLKAILDQFG